MEITLSDHSCYILKSLTSNRCYIGYTVDLSRRIRQHNGEIKGGAKKTLRCRPWSPVCLIRGFYDNSSALRFEWKLQHPRRKIRPREDAINYYIEILNDVIVRGDGAMQWPTLYITWFQPDLWITHPNVFNLQ